MHTPRLAGLGLIGVLALTGCGTTVVPVAMPSPATGSTVQVSTTFGTGGGTGTTYDPALVPVGSRGAVSAESGEGGTTVTLAVRGLEPDRVYGAHAHGLPCGPTGDVAGPHFQHETDPVQPSVDPAFANPDNEIWLDLTTDSSGAGSVTASVPWTFAEDRRAGSVVLHAMATATGAGEAGTAGPRLACISVEF